MVRDDLVTVCRTPAPTGVASDDGATIDLTEACDVLEAWDLRHNLDSVGAHLFQEFWQRVNLDTVWITPFDANDPVNTPRGLNIADPQVKQALVDAVDRLQTLAWRSPRARQRAVRGAQRHADPDPRRSGRHRACSTRSTTACPARRAAATTCRTARATSRPSLGSETDRRRR